MSTESGLGETGHQGHLWLENIEAAKDGTRDWKQLWFVLDEGYMRYFHNDEDLEPLAAVPCRGMVARSVGKSRVGKHAFRVDVHRQEDGRSKYVLAGEDEADSLVWLEFFRDQGVQVNVSKVRLTARAEGTQDNLLSSVTRFVSFGQGGQNSKLTSNDSFLNKAKGFLSFGQARALPSPSSIGTRGTLTLPPTLPPSLPRRAARRRPRCQWACRPRRCRRRLA